MDNYVIEIENPSDTDLDNLSDFMNKVQDETVKYVSDLSEELGVSEHCAGDVYYLRTRSRWSQELENELIELHQKKSPPNMCDFGHKL